MELTIHQAMTLCASWHLYINYYRLFKAAYNDLNNFSFNLIVFLPEFYDFYVEKQLVRLGL